MWQWLLMACLLAGAGERPLAPGLLFDRVVAWVDGETVTQNELAAEASLALAAEAGPAAAAAMTEATLQAALRTLVGEMLVAREARRVGAEAPDGATIEARFTALLEHFSSQEAYGTFVHRLGVDDAFVLDGIGRRLLVDGYLRDRLRTRLLHDEPPAGLGLSLGSRAQAEWRERRFQALALSYRQELFKTVPVRLLRPNGALERVMAP